MRFPNPQAADIARRIQWAVDEHLASGDSSPEALRTLSEETKKLWEEASETPELSSEVGTILQADSNREMAEAMKRMGIVD